MAGVCGDLIRIVATYSTQSVTINILSGYRDTSHDLYRLYIWQQKIAYETRGRCIVPEVLRNERNRWYAYYLMRNKTYFGRVWECLPTPIRVNLPIDQVTYFFVLKSLQGRSFYPVFQDPDNVVYTMGKISTGTTGVRITGKKKIDGRIRRVTFSLEGWPVILTETGTIYRTRSYSATCETLNVMEALQYRSGCVDITYDDSNCIRGLNRDGSIHIVDGTSEGALVSPHSLIEIERSNGIFDGSQVPAASTEPVIVSYAGTAISFETCRSTITFPAPSIPVDPKDIAVSGLCLPESGGPPQWIIASGFDQLLREITPDNTRITSTRAQYLVASLRGNSKRVWIINEQ